jgi:hypothetical protein
MLIEGRIADFMVRTNLNKDSLLADSVFALFRLFSTIKNENDIESFQKGTILDDSTPDVSAFVKSRVMLRQLYMLVSP